MSAVPPPPPPPALDAWTVVKRMFTRGPLSEEERQLTIAEQQRYAAAMKCSPAENKAAVEACVGRMGSLLGRKLIRYEPSAKLKCLDQLDAAYKCQDDPVRSKTTFCNDETDAFFQCFRKHRVRACRTVYSLFERNLTAQPQGFVRTNLYGFDVDLGPLVGMPKK
jgi:hypothetical protein